MEIRWTRRHRRRSEYSGGSTSLTAPLIEEPADDASERPAHMHHLATIHVWDGDGMRGAPAGAVRIPDGYARLSCVREFWQRAERHLDAWADPAQREQLEAELTSVVPRPSEIDEHETPPLRLAAR